MIASIALFFTPLTADKPNNILSWSGNGVNNSSDKLISGDSPFISNCFSSSSIYLGLFFSFFLSEGSFVNDSIAAKNSFG